MISSGGHEIEFHEIEFHEIEFHEIETGDPNFLQN